MRLAQRVFLLMLTTAIQNASAKPLILGHRGARALYPENTQEGFYKTLDAGIRILELDIGMSQEDTLFVHHDTSINPLICKSDTIPSDFFKRPFLRLMSDQAIESFDCGSRTQWWRFPRQRKIRGARIPKLEHFLASVKRDYSAVINEITFLIEVKVKNPETATAQEFAEKVSEIVEKSGLKSQITVQSFSVEFLSALQKVNPSIERALLWEEHWLPSVQQIRELDLKVFLPRFRVINEKLLSTFRDEGIPVISWTLNSKKDWRQAVEWKLNGIITDDPVALKKFLE